jgi:hypothetical protein
LLNTISRKKKQGYGYSKKSSGLWWSISVKGKKALGSQNSTTFIKPFCVFLFFMIPKEIYDTEEKSGKEVKGKMYSVIRSF